MEEMSTSWHSYPSIYALGHRYLDNLFDGPVVIEEKVDGSQFSFGMFGGELRVKSKGKQMTPDAPDKMFVKGVSTAIRLFDEGLLRDGWTYRAEYLQSPKHNTLAYDRTPVDYLILFDVNIGHEKYLLRTDKEAEAQRLGLEVVPVYKVDVTSTDTLLKLLDNISCLGGTRVEGFVVKNYTQFGIDKKILIGKYVSEVFKEKHGVEWRKSNPTYGDILQTLGANYLSEARWRKAVQHLRETGELEESPRDIGKLIKEIPSDIRKECEDEIKEQLFRWAWPSISRQVTRGFPEWWKRELLVNQKV